MTKLHKILTIILVLAGIQTAFAQFTDRKVADEPENVSVIFNNGSFTTGATTASGVATPEGFLWSENAANAEMTASNSTLGYVTTFPAVRLTDNFAVPEGQTWTITSVTAYGFQQNWLAPTSPFSGGTLHIGNSRRSCGAW